MFHLEINSNMSEGRKRGAKLVSPRDWVFGSRPRRLALRFVLDTETPEGGWSKSDLAKKAEVSPNGGIDEHVRGLVDLGILVATGPESGRVKYRRADPEAELAEALRLLLDALEDIPDGPIAHH